MVPTCSVVKSDENSRRWLSKPSTKDSQENFILHIKTSNDFNVKISVLENQKSQQEGTTLQPLLIYLGDSIDNLKEFFVHFDNYL